MFLGSSYSGDVRDLPGHRRDEGRNQSQAKDQDAGGGGGGGGGGDASVKEVINLLERVSIVSMAVLVGR